MTTMVTDTKNVLRNGTSTVMSVVRRGTEAAQRSLPAKFQRPAKQTTSVVREPRARRVPLWPIALTIGAATLAVAATVLVRRVVKATYAIDSAEFAGKDSASGQPDEELVTRR
jgi:hypothetical protein